MHPQVRDKTERGIQDRIQSAVARRGAFPLLAAVTITFAIAFGVLADLTAGEDFDSLGDAIWWALVTLTTVGYGDVVPESVWGRTIGVAVMVLGVTFLSFLTATVTSMFVSNDQSDREDERLRREAEIRVLLVQIDERLSSIEARLAERP